MAFRRELTQVINVKGQIKASKGSSESNAIMNNAIGKFESELPYIVSTVANKLGEHAVNDQKESISQLRAMKCGTLRNSIVMTGGSGGLTVKKEVGTAMNNKYPYILIKGRGEVRPVRAKALYFRNICGKGMRFAKRSAPARPKDYMKLADSKLSAALPGIVEGAMSGLKL